MSYRKLENILSNTGVTAGTYGSNTTALVATVDAAGRLTGLTARPIAVTPDNISGLSALASADTIVRRDANGSFAANTITASLSGRATSAIRLDTPRTLAVSGDVIGSAAFDGTANATITATIRDNLTVGGTAALGLPSGTVGQRPGGSQGPSLPAGTPGMIRYNTVTGCYEVYLPAANRWHALDTLQARFFPASHLDNPAAGSDWPYTLLAPAQSDPLTPALTVRAFDDTASEAVGFTAFVPMGCRNLTVRYAVRCAAAPTGSTNTGFVFNVVSRSIPSTGLMTAWVAASSGTHTAPLTNQWGYYSQSIPVNAADAVAPGLLHQFEFARIGNTPADTVVGDIFLAGLVLEFA